MKYILPALRLKNSAKISYAAAGLVVFFVGLWIVVPVQAATGINDTINFQGKLVDENGLNVADSTYSVVFSLYTVDENGSAIWTETQNVETTDGLFQVSLGAITDLPGSVDFNTDNLYLGIKVGADTEMTPRIRFSAVPYAFNAQKVAGLTVTDTTGTLTIPNGKTIQFADAFSTTGDFALNLTTTGTTSLTLPTTGTLLTNTAVSNQTITSTQTSGTILGLTDTTNITGATTGLSVSLSGTGAFDQTGLSFNLSGASGTNLNDIIGTGNSWKVSRSGDLTVNSCTGCGSGGFSGGYFRLNNGALSPINDTVDLLLGGTASSSANFKFSPSGTSPTASVSGLTSSAAMLVNNNGTGDLFTASSSGLTKFVIEKSGNIVIGADGNIQNNITIRGGTASGTDAVGGDITFDASNGTGSGGSGDFIFRTAASSSGGGGGGAANWCNDNSGVTCTTSWSTRKQITFNNSASATPLTNFPVLVKLDGTRIDYAKTQADGDDLRFVDPDDPTVVLNHEIEGTWTNSGTNYVWVNVPTIDAGSTTDYIWMYYGNASVGSGQNVSGTWSNGYAGVWHLNENPGTAGSGGILDSTSNANNGTDNNGMDASDQVTGKIGTAIDFNGLTQGITLGTPASLELDTEANFTIQAWVKPTTLSGAGCPVAYTYGRWNASLELVDGSSCSGTPGVINHFRNNSTNISGTTVATVSDWNFISVNRDATNTRVYFNGNLDTTAASTTINNSTAGSAIGNEPNLTTSTDGGFQGSIDEVRVSTVVRSADWMKADYLSMTDGMNTFGSEEGQGSGSNDTVNTLTERLRISSSGKIGINTNTLLADFDLRGLSGTTTAASISATTSQATMVVDNNGVGDLFAASASGMNRFVIKNNGNVGIGTTNPTDKLDIVGSVADTGALQGLALTLGNDANVDTVDALNLNVTSASTGDADILQGLNIENLTGGNATVLERAIKIGTGWSNAAGDADISLEDTTPVIRLGATDNTGELSIVDSAATPNTLVQIKDLSTNFGAAVYAGAFIDFNSTVREEFNRQRTSLTVDTTGAQNGAFGNGGGWGVYEGGTTPNCTFSSLADTVNGITRMAASGVATGCMTMIDDAINNAKLMYNRANLPVILMKIRPSAADATSGIYAGLGDSTDGLVTAPTNFIGFSNDNAGTLGTTWTGITRSAGTSTTAVCTGQTVSTTQFALLLIEVRSASSVRFFIDNDVSNGVSLTECGSGSATNIPASNLAPQIHWQERTGGAVSNLDLDFYRTWQDDAPVVDGLTSETVEPLTFDDSLALDDPYTTQDVIRDSMLQEETVEPLTTAVSDTGVLMAGLEPLSSKLAALEDKVASMEAKLTQANDASTSAEVAVNAPAETASNSAVASELLETGDLSVAGLATVSANLRVQGNSLIEGILNVVDTLTVSNIIVNKVANFFAEVIFHSDVIFKGTAYFNQDTAGYVTVKKGVDKAEVKFTKPYDTEPVVNASVVTTKLDDEVFKKFIEEGICDKEAEKATCEEKVTQKAIADAMPFVIGSRSTDGFTILLSQPAAQDLTFSWSALAVIQAEEISLKGGDE